MTNKTIAENFSRRFKEALEMRGLRQQDIADATTINRANISQYANGIRVPKSHNLYQIARALDVSETWLLGYDVPMERNSKGTNDVTITSGVEQLIIEMYREADEHTKDMVIRFLTYSKKMREGREFSSNNVKIHMEKEENED